ncbi:MAG: potassium/proton antiporter [Oscillospiraceae bacterium]|nr:potassium/proton antiporter [Oscillospiraceae bacterium]
MDIMIIVGIILIISVLSCKLTIKTGLPVLVGFILIGIFLGNFIRFEEFSRAEEICSIALLFIIFTGGFQTNFKHVKPVLAVSSIMASLGTFLTSGIAALFAHFVLGLEMYAALLLGAVISCTDAASVFSILSSKKLNLKNNLGSILEMESGSNDPFAYMLTVVFITLASGGSQNVAVLLLMQITIGAAVGFAIAKLGQRMLNRLRLEIDGLHAVLLGGVVLLIYGMAGALGGNSFLAVYIGGMVLGNSKLVYKMYLSRLFGSLSMMMQISLFIVLGVLWIPSTFIAVLPVGLAFAAFMFFVARPAVVYLMMKPFKYTAKEAALVSWAGFRGAASIAFSTYILSAGLPYGEYIFSVVFIVCLLSVILQGSLLSPLAKRLDLVDPEEKKLKPIEDYVKEVHNELLELEIQPGSYACGKGVLETGLPEDIFVVMIKRGGKYIAPSESTKIAENDTLVIACPDKNKIKAMSNFVG